jgi:hypothetical protein
MSQSRIILSITRLISYGYDYFEIVDDDQMLMRPILMAKLMRRYDTACIAQWRGPMATPAGHWMPPPGEYSCYIAPVAARATANKTTIKRCTIKLLAVLTAALMGRYDTARIAQ